MWLSSKFEGPGRNILGWEAGRDLDGIDPVVLHGLHRPTSAYVGLSGLKWA